MQSGKLRHKILIEKYTVTRTANGEATKAWSTYKTVWANITQASGNELVNGADSIEGRITHSVRVRAIDAVDTKANMRVNWSSESRIFGIKAVLADWTNEKYYILQCEEVAPENDGISS